MGESGSTDSFYDSEKGSKGECELLMGNQWTTDMVEGGNLGNGVCGEEKKVGRKIKRRATRNFRVGAGSN